MAWVRPPPAAMTASAPTFSASESPNSMAGRFSRPSAWTSPKPLIWSKASAWPGTARPSLVISQTVSASVMR